MPKHLPRSENDFYARVFIKLFPPNQPELVEIKRGIVRVPLAVAIQATQPDRPISSDPRIVVLQFAALCEAHIDRTNPRNAQSESLTWIKIPYTKLLEVPNHETDEGVEVWFISDSEYTTEWTLWEKEFIKWLKSQGA